MMRSWRASAGPIQALLISQSRVLPSISVKRKVRLPVGSCTEREKVVVTYNEDFPNRIVTSPGERISLDLAAQTLSALESANFYSSTNKYI